MKVIFKKEGSEEQICEVWSWCEILRRLVGKGVALKIGTLRYFKDLKPLRWAKGEDNSLMVLELEPFFPDTGIELSCVAIEGVKYADLGEFPEEGFAELLCHNQEFLKEIGVQFLEIDNQLILKCSELKVFKKENKWN